MFSSAEPSEASSRCPAPSWEASVDAVVALCDGDQRAALRALVAANDYLNAEVERLQAMISNGYARGRAARTM